LIVRANTLVDAQLLPTPNDGQVAIVTFKVTLEGSTDLTLSDEHISLRFFDLDALPAMPSVYRRAILTASGDQETELLGK
jgi:hypothetical protein